MVMNLHNRRAGAVELNGPGTPTPAGGPKSNGSEGSNEPKWRDMEATIEKVFGLSFSIYHLCRLAIGPFVRFQ